MFLIKIGNIIFHRLDAYPAYAVNTNGDVININKAKILKPVKDSRGYLRVRLNGNRILVARLVASEFVPNPEGKQNVTYVDGDRTNVNANNLKWADNSELQSH
jgi:hypothetical protein